MCDCLAETQKALIPRNQRVPTLTVISGPRAGDEKPYVQTEVIKPKRGERGMKLVLTYCPFCGEKYPDADEPSTTGAMS